MYNFDLTWLMYPTFNTILIRLLKYLPYLIMRHSFVNEQGRFGNSGDDGRGTRRGTEVALVTKAVVVPVPVTGVVLAVDAGSGTGVGLGLEAVTVTGVGSVIEVGSAVEEVAGEGSAAEVVTGVGSAIEVAVEVGSV